VEINNKIVRTRRKIELLAGRNNERSAGSKYFQIHSSSRKVPAYRLTTLENKKKIPEIFMAMKIHITVLWAIKVCSLADGYQTFRRKMLLPFTGHK
jgi:hypothetical protein